MKSIDIEYPEHLTSSGLARIAALKQQISDTFASGEEGTQSPRAETVQESIRGGRNTATDDYLHNEAEVLEMLDVCDEIRLRILASLICLPAGPRKGTLADANSKKIGAIVKTPSGLTYALVDNTYVLLLPDLPDEAACNKVIDDLLVLSDHCKGRQQSWLIDFSAVRSTLPVLFLGALYAFRLDMQKEDSMLHIAWLPEGLMPKKMSASLCAAFKLIKTGTSLFSRMSH